MLDAETETVYNEQRMVRKMSMKSKMTSFRDDQSIAWEQQNYDDFLADEDLSSTLVFQKIKPDIWGNLITSMYWEEKIILFIKFYQFLGFTLILFFEAWPAKYQELSGWFCIATFNMHMVGGDGGIKAKQYQYYSMLSEFDPNFWTYLYNYGALVFTVLLGLMMFFNKRINLWNVE